jgi:molybdopterin-guanine dinucleotide biosynthesis protein A
VLRAAVAEVVVAAREGVALPPALDAPVWLEPGDAPRHPLAGIALALRQADGPVLVLAGDMPWVPEALLLAVRDAPGDGAAVARGPGGAEPLVGRYVPANAAALWEAALAGERAREAVAALDPVWIDWGDAGALRSANTPGDLSSA